MRPVLNVAAGTCNGLFAVRLLIGISVCGRDQSHEWFGVGCNCGDSFFISHVVESNHDDRSTDLETTDNNVVRDRMMGMRFSPRGVQWLSPAVKRLIGLIGLIGLSAASHAATEPDAMTDRAALSARVAAVRAALNDVAATGEPAGSLDEQWMNWSNWPNWGKWGNWFNQ